MSRVLLLVDLSYQTYRATAAHRMLSHGPHFTGGLYGFLATVSKIIREIDATRMVVTCDVKPYLRSLEYPVYKTLRREKADEDLRVGYLESIPLVIDLLKAVGVPVLGIEGFESDDLIGSLVNHNRHRWELIYAASNDSDLYQLLKIDNFRIVKGSDLASVISRENIEAGPFGLTPDEFMIAQALQGTHNDVEGIPGIGPTKAYRAVKDAAAMRKLRERYADVIDRNIRLSTLPHPLTPVLRVPQGKTFNPRDLYSYCARYGIDATKSMVDAFDQIGQ